MLNRDSKESIKCQKARWVYSQNFKTVNKIPQDHLSHFINKISIAPGVCWFLHGHTVCVEESRVGFNLLIFSVPFTESQSPLIEKDNGSQKTLKLEPMRLLRKRHFCVLRCYLQTLLLFDLAHTQLQFNNFPFTSPSLHQASWRSRATILKSWSLPQETHNLAYRKEQSWSDEKWHKHRRWLLYFSEKCNIWPTICETLSPLTKSDEKVSLAGCW